MLLLFLSVKIEVTGNSFYKYIHPCDHEELSNQLGGQIPLEDMEIFDGLFCSDSVFMMSNHLKGGSKHVVHENPHKSFFLRMKSTLTSRGKNVNLRASTYRVRLKIGLICTLLLQQCEVKPQCCTPVVKFWSQTQTRSETKKYHTKGFLKSFDLNGHTL